MNNNMKTYIFIIDRARVEIKAMSSYAAKRQAKRKAGAGVTVTYKGVKSDG